MSSFLLVRDIFTTKVTLGVLYYNNQPLKFNGKQVYTCEDAARPDGVKIDKETCIPAGDYKLTITDSVRFKKPMPLIYNNMDKVEGGTVISGYKEWKGIRQHIANDHDDVEGCQGVGFARNETGIYESKPCFDLYLPFLIEVLKSCGGTIDYKIVNQQP